MTDDLTRRLAQDGDQPEPLFDPEPQPRRLAPHPDEHHQGRPVTDLRVAGGRL